MAKEVKDSSPQRIKILFFYVSLVVGGIERSLVTTLQHLDRGVFDPVLALHRTEGEFLKHVPKDIPVYNLASTGPGSYPRMLARIIRILRTEVPEVIVAHTWNAAVLVFLGVLALGRPRRIIVFEHCAPNYLYSRSRPWFISRSIPFLYRLADRIVTVSNGIQHEFSNHYGLPRAKFEVIPNPVDLTRIYSMASEPVDHPFFNDGVPVVAGLGTLNELKNFSTLLKAFSEARKDGPLHLVLIGDGPEREALEGLARELRISADFLITGYQDNPFKFLSRAKLFVLTSLVEGFGYAIVEALTLGIPVISTNCPYGPSEILSRGEYGLLVPVGDIKAIANAMLHILSDAELYQRLSSLGIQRARDFSADRVVKQMEQVFVAMGDT